MPLLLVAAMLQAQSLPARANPTANSSAAGKEVQPYAGYKYVGNTYSLKFHRPSCPFVRCMWSRRMQLFQFRQQAIDSGLKPCRYCLPAQWLQVRAVLLTDKKSAQAGLPAAPTMSQPAAVSQAPR